MPGNSYGTLFRITTFGESHGKGVGVTIDGVPPLLSISEEDIQKELDRRRPGQSDVTSPRQESDTVHILAGVFQGQTTGTPLHMVIYNRDVQSKDYENIKNLYRPGHADFTFEQKYGIRDYRGSGRASGRETAARVAAGAVARKLLARRGITVTGYTLKAAGIRCSTVDFSAIEKNPMRAADLMAAEKMTEAITNVAEQGDSAGGIVECVVQGVDPGLGEPVFDKLDSELAKAMLSIGAVKGIEFGAGFRCSEMKGSEHNDWIDAGGFISNNSGGIVGGISTGQDILFRVAVKPPSSIRVPQKTINTNGKEHTISTEGRHDPCICPRIIPVVEAMTCIVLEDQYKLQRALGDYP